MRFVLTTMQRFGIWILALTVIGAGATFAVVQSTPQRYAADAQVLALTTAVQLSRPEDLAVAQALARNFSALAKSDGVLVDAARQAGVMRSLADLRDATRVTPSRDSFYLTITFVDSDPNTAALMANALTQAFLARAQAVQGELQKPLLDSLRGEITSLGEQIRTVDERVDALLKVDGQARQTDPSTALVDSTIRQQTIANLLELRASLAERFDERSQELRIAVARLNTAVVWQPAVVPESPEPRGIAGAVAAVAATVLLLSALGAALLQARTDQAFAGATPASSARRPAGGHSVP